MVKAGAKLGCVDEEKSSAKWQRAFTVSGACVYLTYFAKEIAGISRRGISDKDSIYLKNHLVRVVLFALRFSYLHDIIMTNDKMKRQAESVGGNIKWLNWKTARI